MFFNNIKHNLIIFFCILLMINGCKNDNTKLIIKNKNEAKQTKPLLVNKNNLQRKVLKKSLLKNNIIKPKEIKNNNITFEFRNERLLQAEIFLIPSKIKDKVSIISSSENVQKI